MREGRPKSAGGVVGGEHLAAHQWPVVFDQTGLVAGDQRAQQRLQKDPDGEDRGGPGPAVPPTGARPRRAVPGFEAGPDQGGEQKQGE